MTDMQIVREQRIGIGRQGQDVLSDEIYIKILASFKGQLGRLKKNRLPVFILVACHEADIMLRAAAPLTLSSIQDILDLSRHTVINALDFLVAERFLEELSERGQAGEKQYRVFMYAWYGRERPSVCRETTPPDSNGANPAPPSVESANFAPVQKSCPIIIDLDRSKNPSPSKTIITGAVQKILHSPGDRFSKDDLGRIKKGLWALGIWENAWAGLLDLEWMSAEYVEDWAEHKRIEGKKRLTGGFYRNEMIAHRYSPYQVRPPEEHRAPRRSDFTDPEWERLSPLMRKSIEFDEAMEAERDHADADPESEIDE